MTPGSSDSWIDAIPDDPYGPCPCGCGTKIRFLLKLSDEELLQHEERFNNKKEVDHGKVQEERA